MIRPIGKHLDALYLTITGDLPDAIATLLEHEKECACETENGRSDLFEDDLIPGGPLWISAKGTKGYEFIVRNHRLYMKLTKQGHLPALSIQFMAEALYEYDLDGLQAVVDRLCELFVPEYREQLVNRADIAVDFQSSGKRAYKLPDHRDVVTRAVQGRYELNRREIETFTLGKHNGTMQVQIYNKTAEVAKKGKAWLRQVWEEGSYDPEKPVWRAEVRFYRDILSALQIRGIPDLREHLGDLLVYAVDPDQPGAWVRFVQPSTRKLRSARRESAHWWRQVARGLMDGDLRTGRRRLRPKGLDSMSRAMDMYTAWAAKVAAIARKGKLHNGREGFGDWLHAHMHAHLRRKDRMTWADAVNRQFSKLEELPAFGGVLFDLTPAEIPADTPRIAELRLQDREHRRAMEDRSSLAWRSAVEDLDRRNHENALVARIRRIEAHHADPDPPELSGSSLRLLEERPSIKHEAGFYVSQSQTKGQE